MVVFLLGLGVRANAAEGKATGPDLRSASSALVVDANNGEVIFERDAKTSSLPSHRSPSS